MERLINRRDFLRYGVIVAGAAILAACSPSEQKRIKRELLSYRLGQDRPTLQAMKTAEAKSKQDTQAPMETAIAQRVAMDLTSTAESQPTKSPTPKPVSMPVDESKNLIYGVGGTVGIIATYVIGRFIGRKLRQPKSVINSDQPRMENLPTTHHSVGDNVPEILHPLKKDVLWYKDGKPYRKT